MRPCLLHPCHQFLAEPSPFFPYQAFLRPHPRATTPVLTLAPAHSVLPRSPYKLNPRLLPCKAPPLETPVVAAFLGASVPPCRVCVGGRGRASASHDMLPVPCPHQVALLQLMGAPELSGQENALEMHPLKMK